MDKYQSLYHTAWDCKNHVVFIPKCRRRTWYGEQRRYLGEVFHRPARQKECKVLERHLMPVITRGVTGVAFIIMQVCASRLMVS